MRFLVTLIATAMLFGSAAAQQPEVVASGELYCYGNAIPAPYTGFTVENGVGSINGIQVVPAIQGGLAETVAININDPRSALNERASSLQRELVSRHAPLAIIADQVAALYASDQEIVERVEYAQGSDTFLVWWKGESSPECVTVTDTASINPNAVAQDQIDAIRHNLSTGCIVIICSTVTYTVPPTDAARTDAVHAEIAQARLTPQEAFDTGQWKGLYLPTDAAKQFSAPLTISQKEH